MNAQLKWELLNCEILKFTIDYTIWQAKETRKQQAHLESELKKFENNLENSDQLRKRESLQNDLELIYDHIVEEIKIRSKCSWYEQGKKLSETESENLL